MHKVSSYTNEFDTLVLHLVRHSVTKFESTVAQGHMQHSPSVQCSEAVQQHPHTLVLAVAAVACKPLSENSTFGS